MVGRCTRNSETVLYKLFYLYCLYFGFLLNHTTIWTYYDDTPVNISTIISTNQKYLHSVLWYSIHTIRKILLLNLRPHRRILHRHRPPWIRGMIFCPRPVPGQMPQLHRPCMSPKRPPNQQCHSRLWILRKTLH